MSLKIGDWVWQDYIPAIAEEFTRSGYCRGTNIEGWSWSIHPKAELLTLAHLYAYINLYNNGKLQQANKELLQSAVRFVLGDMI